MLQNTFRVLGVSPGQQTIKLARDDYWDGICPTELINTTIDFNHFSYVPGLWNLTLYYNCSSSDNSNSYSYSPSPQPLSCTVKSSTINLSYSLDPIASLNSVLLGGFVSNVRIPINETAAMILYQNPTLVNDTVKAGFDLKWEISNDQCENCLDSGGDCGYNVTTTFFTCFCQNNQSWPNTCPSKPVSPNKTKLYTGLGIAGAAIVGILLGGWALFAILTHGPSMLASESNSDIEVFIRNNGSLAPKRYSLSEIKKMTSSYKEKVGQGGYGNVYKGNLPDSQIVAVKVLNASNGNGEEFINEVASIGRTSHVNVVTLVGFCLEGNKRALIYEFMPNGSLEKFIFKECSVLGWKKLYDIALGIARGLEYLHRGCNTRILHFDIKPHNILLDQNFCPKISDFGLSKLCTRDNSIVSMLEARGTIGYIAPEIFSRSFGAVSHKSDVYSYGMMVLEMVGGKKSGKIGVSASNECFPDSIYEDLEVIEKLELQGLKSKEETNTEKKMILVGLWSIQTKPSKRPSTDKVIEMLEGSVESLPIPPKPSLSSPLISKSISNSTDASSLDDTILLED